MDNKGRPRTQQTQAQRLFKENQQKAEQAAGWQGYQEQRARFWANRDKLRAERLQREAEAKEPTDLG